MKSREGYTRVPVSWADSVPEEIGTGVRACSLCPDYEECRSSTDCDAGTALVWVPDHIYLVWRVNASDESLRQRDWRVMRHQVKEQASNR